MTSNSNQQDSKTLFTVQPVQPRPRGVRVHRLTGLLKDGSHAYAALRRFRDELEASEDAVILDLGEIVHITSGGVAILAALYMAARDAGRALVLARPSPQLSAVLRVSGLLPIIPAYDSLEEASRAVDDMEIESTQIRTGTD